MVIKNNKKKPPKKQNKKVGRPTKYTPSVNKQMIDFFSVEPYREETRTKVSKDGTPFEVDVIIPNDLPLISSFCCEIGVTRETLHNWANDKDIKGKLKHPEFFDTYKRCKDFQERILVTNGLKGLYNNTFSIFTAKNIIGWRDKQDIEHKFNISDTINSFKELLGTNELKEV